MNTTAKTYFETQLDQLASEHYLPEYYYGGVLSLAKDTGTRKVCRHHRD